MRSINSWQHIFAGQWWTIIWCYCGIFWLRWCWQAVAKVLWTCVLQVQRKFRSKSVHVLPLETAGIITVEMIPYCGPMSHGNWGCFSRVWSGPQFGGISLAGCRFLCAGKYTALLISLLSTSKAAPSSRLMRALNIRGTCSCLGECKGSWMVGYLCSCSGCAVTRHLEQ